VSDGEHPEAALPARLVGELRGQLLGAVRRAAPPWLASQAEDIVQTTMIRIVAAHRKSGGNLELRPSYWKRAAYNATVDEMRKRFRKMEISAEREPEPAHASTRPDDPESRAAAVEIHAAIRDCLGDLLRSRRVAVACHLQGYSVPEAARFLGWSSKKTEHLVRRGMEELRTCLTKKGLKP
jgi:RNA polymerase sigma factor (sigma-70 family)